MKAKVLRHLFTEDGHIVLFKDEYVHIIEAGPDVTMVGYPNGWSWVPNGYIRLVTSNG